MSEVKVQIFGETYPITADLDEAYVQRVAAYVDGKMQAVARMAPFMDRHRWAVLAALAIADELHKLQDDNVDREDAMRDIIERCLKLVEATLQHAPTEDVKAVDETSDT